MIRFIDMHRDQFGVELICRALKDAVRGFLTSRGYRAAKTRPASRTSCPQRVPQCRDRAGGSQLVYALAEQLEVCAGLRRSADIIGDVQRL